MDRALAALAIGLIRSRTIYVIRLYFSGMPSLKSRKEPIRPKFYSQLPFDDEGRFGLNSLSHAQDTHVSCFYSN